MYDQCNTLDMGYMCDEMTQTLCRLKLLYLTYLLYKSYDRSEYLRVTIWLLDACFVLLIAYICCTYIHTDIVCFKIVYIMDCNLI